MDTQVREKSRKGQDDNRKGRLARGISELQITIVQHHQSAIYVKIFV